MIGCRSSAGGSASMNKTRPPLLRRRAVSRDEPALAHSPADARALILAVVRRIPRGRVCPYGNVAQVAGLPRRARLVGTVLRQGPAARGLPWHRVINASGRISFPVGSDAYALQRRRLEAEGVVFVGGRIDLQRYGWPDRAQQLDELLWKPSEPQRKRPARRRL